MKVYVLVEYRDRKLYRMLRIFLDEPDARAEYERYIKDVDTPEIYGVIPMRLHGELVDKERKRMPRFSQSTGATACGKCGQYIHRSAVGDWKYCAYCGNAMAKDVAIDK